MAIKRPDTYEHNNPSLPIVEAKNVGGGYLSVNSIAERNAIPLAKRGRLIDVKGVNLFRYIGTNFEEVNWLSVDNWKQVNGIYENILTPVAVGSPVTHHTNTIISLDKENEFFVDMVADIEDLRITLPDEISSKYILLKALVNDNLDRKIKFINANIQFVDTTSGVNVTVDGIDLLKATSGNMNLYEIVGKVQRMRNTTYVFITHNLISSVTYVA